MPADFFSSFLFFLFPRAGTLRNKATSRRHGLRGGIQRGPEPDGAQTTHGKQMWLVRNGTAVGGGGGFQLPLGRLAKQPRAGKVDVACGRSRESYLGGLWMPSSQVCASPCFIRGLGVRLFKWPSWLCSLVQWKRETCYVVVVLVRRWRDESRRSKIAPMILRYFGSRERDEPQDL
ncbi:hypothetical protein BDP55DRAFT_98359 [Colletotrichum godetiae]|uniref:Secreted protein n=1 Tax=Colletotrichum godetiae TaxID=1209918 RepID=A0AAJ0EZ14_9PEZI|nr:uncharacterized protein BDP55DRAFT_98359 [Colletotrichum godetiae]KAK1676704.1 hypothetical protein BDP55DRAFT_98359 [Colletotrichum godetiae]